MLGLLETDYAMFCLVRAVLSGGASTEGYAVLEGYHTSTMLGCIKLWIVSYSAMPLTWGVQGF